MFEDMQDVRDHVNSITSLLHHLDDHLGHLQDLSGLTLDSMKTLTAQKAMEFKRSHSLMSCDLSLSKQTTDDGLGQSTTWKKSKSSQIWARSFSQPGLEKYIKTPSSLQRTIGSDFGPVHNALFYPYDHLLECQDRTVDNDNIDYDKHKSLKSKPHEITTHSPSPEKQDPEVINVSPIVQSNKSPLQGLPKCPDLASTTLLGKTFKKEGFVNGAFTDDDNKAVYENDTGDGGPYVKLSSEMKNKAAEQPLPEVSPNIDSHDAIVTKYKEQHSNNNKLTGVFYKLWKQSKRPGNTTVISLPDLFRYHRFK